MNKDWCLIESDPVGVKGIQVEDIYSLDEKELRHIAPIYGLIFLFKWVGKRKPLLQPLEFVPSGLFYAKQQVTNACATQAILSVLLNIGKSEIEVDLGKNLERLKEFSEGLSPSQIGDSIGSCEPVRTAHNSFHRPEPFQFSKSVATEDDDVFHFVSYVPHKGRLYELDGLLSGPVEVCKCSHPAWISKATEYIKKRIEQYKLGEIKFHLMGVVHDRQVVFSKELKDLETQSENFNESQTDGPFKTKGEILAKIEEVKAKKNADLEKKRKWELENKRRKHNYVPFLCNMVKLLAEKNVLLDLVEEAKKEDEEARKKKKKKKDSDGDVEMKDKGDK